MRFERAEPVDVFRVIRVELHDHQRLAVLSRSEVNIVNQPANATSSIGYNQPNVIALVAAECETIRALVGRIKVAFVINNVLTWRENRPGRNLELEVVV